MDLGALQPLLFLGLPLLFGMALLRVLGIVLRTDNLAYWGWAWLLGCLGTGLMLGLWLSVSLASREPGAPIDRWVPTLLLVGLGMLAWLGARRMGAAPLEPVPEARRLKGALWERCCFRAALAFLLSFCLQRILDGAQFSLPDQAQASTWTQHAKLLYAAGGFQPAYAKALAQAEPALDALGLLNPLLQTWCFVSLGRVPEQGSTLIIQAFCPALVLILAGGMRCRVRPGIAALLLLLLGSMAPFVQATWLDQSELMLGLGGLLCLDGILRWSRDQVSNWLWLAGLGLAFGVASDARGSLLLATLFGALLLAWLLRLRSKQSLLQGLRLARFSIPALALLALATVQHNRFQQDNEALMAGPQAEASTSSAARLLSNLERFSTEALGDRLHSSYLLLAFAVLALVFLLRALETRLVFGAAFIGLQLLGLALFTEEADRLAGAGRAWLIVLPSLMLWIAACAGAHLGLSPSTHDPRAAAQALGALRPLRSVFLGYLIVMALGSTASAASHMLQALPHQLRGGLNLWP